MSAPLSVPPRCWSPSGGRLKVAGGSWRPLFSSAFPVLACPAASRSFPFVGAARAVVGATPRFKKRAPDARLRKGGELSV